ncbi:MAG: YitT family protein [Oscillospiraceae bacterium]
MNTPREQRWKALSKYLLPIIGAAILSFGLYNVHRQNDITEGGVLGMTLLLNHWFGISPAISGFVMDVTCYIIGFKFLGKQFAKYSIVASISFALSYSIYEKFDPVLPSMADMPLLAAVVGALFVGVGVGMVVLVGGASGGDDALALVITHVTTCKIARAYLATDLIVLALSLSYIPVTKIVFSLVTVTLSSAIIGFIQKIGEERGLRPQDCKG